MHTWISFKTGNRQIKTWRQLLRLSEHMNSCPGRRIPCFRRRFPVMQGFLTFFNDCIPGGRTWSGKCSRTRSGWGVVHSHTWSGSSMGCCMAAAAVAATCELPLRPLLVSGQSGSAYAAHRGQPCPGPAPFLPAHVYPLWPFQVSLGICILLVGNSCSNEISVKFIGFRKIFLGSGGCNKCS